MHHANAFAGPVEPSALMHGDHAHGTQRHRPLGKTIRPTHEHAAAAAAAVDAMHEAHESGTKGRYRRWSEVPEATEPSDELDMAQSLELRDAKREERELLFAKGHMRAAQHASYGGNDAEPSATERSAARARHAQNKHAHAHGAARHMMHAAHASQERITPRARSRDPQGGLAGGVTAAAAKHDAATAREGGVPMKSPRAGGLVGPHVVGGVDAESPVPSMMNDDVFLRRREKEARLKEMFDAKKDSYATLSYIFSCSRLHVRL